MLLLERAEPPVMAAFLQRPSLLARWAGDGAGQVAGIKLQTSYERLPLHPIATSMDQSKAVCS